MTTDPVEITRYPNRRLYDRSRGQYVTLPEIEEIVRSGRTVVVRDSKSGEDLTRAVLAQIILERHPERIDVFPVSLLHMALRANDLALDWLRTYLRQSLAFLEHLPPPPFPTTPPFAPPLANPLVAPFATPLDWMKAMFPSPPTGAAQAPAPAESPADAAPVDLPRATSAADAASAALLERLAELERRLRELEGQRPA